MRPAVSRFADLMDGQVGTLNWQGVTTSSLISAAQAKLAKLIAAHGKVIATADDKATATQSQAEVVQHATDMANRLMMIADNVIMGREGIRT